MTDLSQLIERVEAATEGSRELDARIACYFDNRSIHEVVDNGVLGRHVLGRSNVAPHDICVVSWARHYTTSIDAALTLMPEGAGWLVGSGRTRPDEPIGGARITSLDGETIIAEAEAATPCLALLAAILRARQAADTESQS